jgi:hypothetical protein
MLVSSFGIRIKEDELREFIVSYLLGKGYEAEPNSINIVPLTNGRIEVLVKPFNEIKE